MSSPSYIRIMDRFILFFALLFCVAALSLIGLFATGSPAGAGVGGALGLVAFFAMRSSEEKRRANAARNDSLSRWENEAKANRHAELKRLGMKPLSE